MIEENMSIFESDLENSDAYKVKLENFEGPLDLLLHLIKDAKLEIENVKLSEITDQYLSYLKEIGTLDLEKSADFIDIASILIEIKAKSLLPKKEDDEIVVDDSERLLLQRLQEYKLFKEASEQLKIIEDVNKFYKNPDESAGDYRVILKDMNMENLISAFTKLMQKTTQESALLMPKTIEKERWTVEEKIFELETVFINKKRVKFEELAEKDYSKLEVITLFIALLELLKRQVVKVVQTEQFGEIEIIKNEEEVANNE